MQIKDAECMYELGVALAAHMRAGDMVILDGPLGAGKTTLTRGIGDGLGVRGPVTSPTFVVARVHPSLVEGPPLVHVDAYRLNSAMEVEHLDLDSDLADSVTVVEWGSGRVNELSADPLVIQISREPDSDTRQVSFTGGPRWSNIDWASLTTC